MTQTMQAAAWGVQVGLQVQALQVLRVVGPKQRRAVLGVLQLVQEWHDHALGGGVLMAGCCYGQWHHLKLHW
jgi:hypothetical protein